MKTTVSFLVLFLSFHAFAQNFKPATLRSILLEQLRTTHNEKDWFVPISVAVEGLTAEQASWKDGSGNHSVGQLSNHLLFWNKRELLKFKGEPEEKFSGNNDETFNNFDSKKWSDTVKQLDQVMMELEKLVELWMTTSYKPWRQKSRTSARTMRITWARSFLSESCKAPGIPRRALSNAFRHGTIAPYPILPRCSNP